jgi:hypothetical protein
MRILLPLLFLATPSFADCQDESLVFSCKIKAQTLEICHGKGALTYTFGPEGKPDLSIAEPLETVDFTPWPGMGRYIWEAVAFRNAGFTYEVWSSVERGADATTGREAAVTVFEGDTEIARPVCDAGSITGSLDRIYDLKQSIGQCWDYKAKAWAKTCD